MTKKRYKYKYKKGDYVVVDFEAKPGRTEKVIEQNGIYYLTIMVGYAAKSLIGKIVRITNLYNGKITADYTSFSEDMLRYPTQEEIFFAKVKGEIE